MEELLQSILDVISNGANSVLDFLLDGFSSFFEAIFTFLFDFIFITMKDFILSVGDKILNFFFNMFSGAPSLSFLPYFIGMIFFIFIVKRVFDVLR